MPPWRRSPNASLLTLMPWPTRGDNRELRWLITGRYQHPNEGDLLGVLLGACPPLDEQALCQTLVSILLASHGVPAAALACRSPV